MCFHSLLWKKKKFLKFNNKVKLRVLIVFFIIYNIIVEGEYISSFGKIILKKSNLILIGKIVNKYKFIKGGSIVRVKILKLYKGSEKIGAFINIFYINNYRVKLKEKWLFFLKQISDKSYRSIGEISLKDKDIKYKLESLKEILEIENIPIIQIKIKTYLNKCIIFIKDKKSTWKRHFWFKELEYYFNFNFNSFNKYLSNKEKKEIYNNLKSIYLNSIIEKDIKEGIKKILIKLQYVFF